MTFPSITSKNRNALHGQNPIAAHFYAGRTSSLTARVVTQAASIYIPSHFNGEAYPGRRWKLFVTAPERHFGLSSGLPPTADLRYQRKRSLE